MNTPGKQTHFGLQLLASYLLYAVGLVVYGIIDDSDPVEGLALGFVMALLFSIVWLIYVLPWSLFIYWLYRRHQWQRFRFAWMLAPVMVFLVWMLGSALEETIWPAKKFERATHCPLPRGITDFHYRYSNGLLQEDEFLCCFRCSPQETAQLIAGLKLVKEECMYLDNPCEPVSPLPNGWPDCRTWTRPVLYRDVIEPHHKGWTYLLTDERQEKVCIELVF
jgi:hypothetical protein